MFRLPLGRREGLARRGRTGAGELPRPFGIAAGLHVGRVEVGEQGCRLLEGLGRPRGAAVEGGEGETAFGLFVVFVALAV